MTEAKPVGRPRNPTDAEKGYKDEVLAWVKVAKRIRGLIEKMLDFFEEQLKNVGKGGSTLSVETMLDVMEGLGKLLATSSRTIESGLAALEKGTKGPSDDDPEAIMDRLKGGLGG